MRNFYSFLQKKLGRAEEDLYVIVKEEKYKSFKFYFYDIFIYLALALQYLFFGFLEFLIKFFVLIFKTPKEAYEILVAPLEKLALEEERVKKQIRPFPEFVEYHKKTRMLSNRVFGILVVAVVVVSVIITLIFPVGVEVLGATYTFTQTNWSGGGTANTAAHPTNSSNWTEYSSIGSGIVAVNNGADLELASTTASVTKTSEADFSGGTLSSATTTSSGSVKLSKALHINEYTIGALSNIAVTASSVTVNSNGTWTIAFSGTPNLARLFKNDKFTDSASKAWKVLSVAPSVYKIIVVDSEGNTPTVSAPATGSGTVGRWYASISAWEAGRNADITATGRNAIERGLPYYDGAADITAVLIDGWTTDATHYIEVYVPLSERHRGKWDNNKYRLEPNATYQAINLNEEYTRLDGLQIKHTANGGSQSPHTLQIAINNSNSDIHISNNILDGINVSSTVKAYAIDIYSANTANIRVWNNVFYNYNTGGTGTDHAIYLPASGGTAYVYNNTIYGTETGIRKTGGITVVAKNNIAQNVIDGFSGTFDAASDYNISSIASDAPGANSINATTTPFADISSNDFHLDFRDGTGNPAMNAGTSAVSEIGFTTDIDGDTRSGTWDIGADDVGATLVMAHSIGTASRDFSTLQAWEDARDGNLTANQRKVFRATQQAAITEGETVTGQTSGATGVYIKEEAIPTSSLKGDYNTPGGSTGIYVSGNYAYLADGTTGLYIINISNPASPSLAGSLDTSGTANDVYVSGSYAYVTDGANGLRIINISDPALPTETGFYDTPGTAYEVQVVGSYAYVSDDTGGLQIINVSTPTSPTLAGSYSTPNLRADDLYVVGSYAYITDTSSTSTDSGLRIINVSNPASPTESGFYDTPGAPWGLYISGNYAYVADGPNPASGLQIVNISNPASPTSAGTYITYATDVYISGNYAYVAGGSSGLKIVDISNPASPIFAGVYDPPGTTYEVHVIGGYAYVAGGERGLQVIKPLEYFTLEGGSGTFQLGESVVGATSGATSTIGAILTTQGTIEKGEAYNDSTFTAGVTIDGSTTDANHYMWLTAEPRSRHRGVAGTGVKISGVSGDVIYILNDYTIAEWLEITNWTTTDYGAATAINFNANRGTARNNIIHDPIQNSTIRARGTRVSNGNPSANPETYNNIIYNFIGVDNDTQAINTDEADSTYNNTIYNIPTGYGINYIRSYSDAYIKNNIVIGCGTCFVTGSAWNASYENYNISSDATAPGTNSLTNVATSSVRFVSTASDFVDLHILDGSVAKDAGADLSATFNTDADGQTRPNGAAFDAGADEWFSSSPVYNTTGTFTSGTIDLGNPVNFDTLIWNPTSTQPVSGSLKFAVAAKSADSGWADSDFIELNREAYPTGVTVHTSYIRPSGQCTGYSPCYNSLSAWEAAQQRDLTVSDEIEVAQIGGSWTSPDTTTVTIDGWTTDATHYIRIYTTPEARHNGKWDNTKYRLEVSSNNDTIQISDTSPYTRIEGLQIQQTTGSYADRDGIDTSGNFMRISGNLIKGINSDGNGIRIASTQQGFVWNNIIYGFGAGFWADTSNLYPTSYVYNNTITNSTNCFSSNQPHPIYKNNIAQNCVDGFGSADSASNYNISNLTSDAPGVNSKNSTTVSFIDSANKDFRLASSDTGAKDSGTSTVSEIGFTIDINGHLRTSPSAGSGWDIGAHEYGATGGNIAASLDGNRYLRYKAYLSTADSAHSPQLDDLTVNYSYYATSSPYLVSSWYNTNDATNILGKISWTATTTSGTEIRVQVRSAPNSSGVPGTPSQWCGPTVCDASDYFSSANNGVDLASNHPLKNGGNDQWLQYLVYFVSNGASTPTFGNIVLTYVVNAPPVLSTPAASQRTSDGKVVVDFTGYDVDTATGTAHPNQVSLTMEYWNGSTWVSASSVTGSTGWIAVSANSGSPTSYQFIWDAKTDFGGIATTTAKVRVTADDGEGANNTGVFQSAEFSLDTKNPVATLKVDGTYDGQSGAIAYVITDDNTVQCKGSNNSDYSADGLNANSGSWVTTTTSTTTWDFTSNEPVKIYSQCKDTYQNSVTLTSEAPVTPANIVIRDSSDVAESQFREFISWDVSTSSDFASYKVYRSTDGTNYSLLSTITDINQNFLTNGSSGAWLTQGTTYYYKVLVLDSDINNSRFSSVVSDVVDGQGGTDVTSPTISNVSVSSIRPSQATITWTTDELSDSAVYYSTNLSYESSKSSAAMVTSHSVTLTGLSPSATYNIRLVSIDPSLNSVTNDASAPGTGNLAASFSFTTSAGPVISSVSVSSVSGSSATIVWNTNVDSDSFVEFSINSNLSSSQSTGTTTFAGGSAPLYGHSVTLTGLTVDTKYYFKVKSTDSTPNLAQDDNGGAYYTFTTVRDVTAPVISSVSATLVDDDSAVITWITNELADSRVQYGLSSDNLTSQTTLDTTLTTSHSAGISSLIPQTQYYYRVVSKDADNNQSVSSVYNFTTTDQTYVTIATPPTYIRLSPPATVEPSASTVEEQILRTEGETITQTTQFKVDRESPTVMNLKISEVTESSVRVIWETDEPATSLVEYGETTVYGFTQGRYDFKTSHDVIIQYLHEGTDYNYRIKSFDNVGNFTESANKVFKTLPAKESIEKKVARLTEVKSVEEINALTQEITDILATLSDKILPPLIVGERPDIDISSSFAVIKWSTDRPSGSVVAYSEEKDYIPESYVSLAGDAEEQATAHSVLLANLKPGTTYHFQLRSKALVGGIGKSKDFTFTTKAEAGISDLLVSDITIDSVTITWKTTVPATTRLEYGLTSDYANSKTDDAFNISHIVRLTNLTPGTLYRYRVGGVGQDTKQFFSPNLTFVTEALPSLLDVNVESVEDREVSITWFTDVAADSTVVYTNLATGKTTTYGDKQFVKNHQVQLEGLEQGTEYKLQVVSKDEKGNEVKSSEYSFATSKDVQAPLIFNVQTQSAIFSRDKVQTIISWRTDEPATSQVTYQEGTAKDPKLEKQSKLNPDMSTTHTAVFTNFKPGAIYRFHLENIDQSGNVASSKDFSILTPQREETVFDLIVQNFRDIFRWTEGLQ